MSCEFYPWRQPCKNPTNNACSVSKSYIITSMLCLYSLTKLHKDCVRRNLFIFLYFFLRMFGWLVYWELQGVFQLIFIVSEFENKRRTLFQKDVVLCQKQTSYEEVKVLGEFDNFKNNFTKPGF